MARVLTGGAATHVLTEERLDAFLFRHLQTNGDAIFLTNATTRQQYTCNQVLDISKRLAAGLQSRGFRHGDTITVYALNSEHFVFVVLASIHAGLIVNTVNPAATAYELRHYLREVQPNLIYTEESLVGNIESALDANKIEARILTKEKTSKYEHVLGLCAERHVPVTLHPVDVKEDVAFILFSSGTSGLPKGVLLTQYNVTNQLILRRLYGWHPDITRSLAVFPMYHGAGLFSGIFGYISTSTNYIFLEKHNFKLMLETIQVYKPQCAGLPPTVIVQLAKSPLVDEYDLSSIRFCITGAAPLKRETEAAFKKRFNYPHTQQAYGMTEAVAGIIWTGLNPESSFAPGSSGKAGIGVEIKVIDTDSGKMVGPNTRGEILMRTPTVMKGYLNRPAATKETLDTDGWLHSGDIGYYDKNENLFIVDRLKELIKYKGNQVAPAELEAVLLEHPDVADVGVIGVPSTEAGELPRAYIVKQPGSNLKSDDIHTFVNSHVSYYKQLRGGVVFVDEIPKLPSGKILRRHLRERAKMEASKI